MTAQSPCKRTAPFLHRNFLSGVKALQKTSSVMGNIISTPMQKLPHDGDGDDARPAKRRRISPPGSFDIDHLIASPRMSESGSTLRIEVLKILHKDSKKVKSYQAAPRNVLTTKARCKVTIFDTSSGPPQVLHCQSQMCNLITFENPAGPHRIARVDLPRPFFITHDSILINRPDDGGFDLSDSYQLVIELEAANARHWPPLNSQDFGIPTGSLYPPWGSTRHWILSSKFDSVFGRLRNPLNLSARYPSDQSSYQTNYMMDVDLRWTAGFKALRRLDKDSKPCITAVDPDASGSDDALSPFADGPPAVNGINGHTAVTESPTEQDDEFAGDQTPSRSLRAREKNKIYNLKVLSDQQLGREKKQRGRNLNTSTSDGRVQYVLPSYQPVSLDYYRCINCGAYHESMDQLQLHLQLAHPTYDYVLENTNDGPLFRVSALRESTASPQKTFHLGRNVKPFHIRTVLSGDQAWLMSRMGAYVDESLKSPTKNVLDRNRTASPVSRSQKIIPRQPEKPKFNKAIVPDIPQPLFHPISKARLKPGQDVPVNTPDSTWLIQKHRESISDFSDVTPVEKEYIWEWDGYILRQGVISAAYLPRAWLEFVKSKASWLAGTEQRMREFGKHCCVLLARNALDDDDMQHAFRYINEARAKRPADADQQTEPTSPLAKDKSTKQSPRVSQIRKGANGCTICQLPVLGPRLLLCSNTACTKRLYHIGCVQNEALLPVTSSSWLCNDCAKSKTSG